MAVTRERLDAMVCDDLREADAEVRSWPEWKQRLAAQHYSARRDLAPVPAAEVAPAADDAIDAAAVKVTMLDCALGTSTLTDGRAIYEQREGAIGELVRATMDRHPEIDWLWPASVVPPAAPESTKSEAQ